MDKYRRSIRLKNHDYSRVGKYFITICTKNRECLFGDVVNGEVVLNDIGNTINTQWNKLLNRFNNIQLDEYVVMPNHFHGIIIIKSNPIVGVSFMKPDIKMEIIKSNRHMGLMNQTPTLGQIIRYFKSKCTYEIHKNKLNVKLWQRNYYEHIIRTENDLNKIRKYIKTNSKMWEMDMHY
ncbi:hypothetical protein A3H26_03280 [candidate division WWE3 bacterium RIFCSPLOWO2_12_FULL_36_10]|uniref:Transposase IS200-like domain-containing protein n=1 Tax=candidate division WWE3 bacterium RIFCSPLOWO2_12_FULL_36_10 TaxID=1802630 RepID=A0A1F4VJA3_UNCKA|nr:MAG: hypothetical protein A3H26_03280 [candidate division WWE3 bacterium RIFCSPLOWO2_12_FULL_36_10]